MLRLSAFLAMRQLIHRGPSAIGGLAGVCVAVVLMFMQLGFRNALYDSSVNIPQALDADIFIVAPQYQSLAFSPPWMARQILKEASSVDGIATARPLYAFSGQLRSPRTGGNMSGWIMAFDLDQPVFKIPEINENINRLRLPFSAFLDSRSRYDYRTLRDGLLSGSEPRVSVYQPGANLAPVITLNGLFTLGPTFTIDGLVVMSDLNFYRLLSVPLDRVSLGLVKLAPGADQAAALVSLARILDGRAKVMSRDQYIAAEKNFYATRTPIGIIFNIGLFVGVVVGVVFISQVLHGIIDSNLREYAVLAAMGYKSTFFMIIVFEIATAIAIFTFVPSVIVSAGLYGVAGAATLLPLSLRIESVMGVLVLVLLMGNVAALMAMRKLKLANPLDLFS
jgi:putative ABC transport system permease protein